MPYTRVRKPDGTCCKCEDQVKCVCAGVNGCGLECRSKSATATLCGFSEFPFGVASVPPKLYKRRTTSGEMNYCEFAGEECMVIGPTINTWSSSGQVDFGDGRVLVWSATLEFLGMGAGQAQFLVHCEAVLNQTGNPPDPRPVTVDGHIDGAVYPFAEGVHNVCVVPSYGTPNVSGSCADMTVVFPIHAAGFKDSWDKEESYGADCALTVEDNSTRMTSEDSESCPIFGGDENPLSGPVDYGPDAPFVIVSKTKRNAVGNEDCEANGEGAKITSGTVTEELSDEDTDEDAIERAKIVIEYSPCDTCLRCAAFITLRINADDPFSFRAVEVRAHLVALKGPLISAGPPPVYEPGLHRSFEVTIGYYRRVLGSTGPWLFHAQDQVTITPESEEEVASSYTPWFDVPNEAGFETRAQTCSVEDVTLS